MESTNIEIITRLGWKKAFLCEIMNKDVAVPDGFEDAYNIVTNSLLEREQYVLNLRFQQGETFREIAHNYGRSVDRIRVIYFEAITRLRRPENIMLLSNGYSGFKMLKNVEEEKKRCIAERNFGVFWIKDLGLSVRAFNCLNRKGFKTVQDIVDNIKHIDDLHKIRNLGKISINEICEKLEPYGIKFDEG